MSEFIIKNKNSLKSGIIEVPVDINDKVGFSKLKAIGFNIDTLTKEPYTYIDPYKEGT